MTAAAYPMGCSQNEDFYRALTYRQRNADGTPGTIIDLTGYSAKMTIRLSGGGAPLLVMTPSNNDIIISNGLVSPNIELIIPRTVCETFPLEGASYDLVLIDATGKWHPLLYGPFLIQEGIST